MFLSTVLPFHQICAKLISNLQSQSIMERIMERYDNHLGGWRAKSFCKLPPWTKLARLYFWGTREAIRASLVQGGKAGAINFYKNLLPNTQPKMGVIIFCHLKSWSLIQPDPVFCSFSFMSSIRLFNLIESQTWWTLFFKLHALEYQQFEYQKHLNTELFEVLISNGLVFKWSVFGLFLTFVHNREVRKCRKK